MKKVLYTLMASAILGLGLVTTIYYGTAAYAQSSSQTSNLKVEVVAAKLTIEGEQIYIPGSISEDLIAVESGGKYGYVDLNENIVIPYQYKYARPFTGGRALVQGQDDKFYIIDTTGAKKPVLYNGKQLDGKSDLHPMTLYGTNLVQLFQDGPGADTCYVDLNGKIVLPLAQYDPNGFHNDFLLSDKGIYNTMGTLVTKWKTGMKPNLGHDIDHAFIGNGLIPVYTKEASGKQKYGYVNMNGNVAIPPTYDAAFPFSGGYAVVRKDDHSFIINTKNERCTPNYASNAYPPNGLGGGYMAGRFVASTGLLDTDGKTFYGCKSETWLVTENNTYGRENVNLNPVFIVINKKDKYGVIDKYANIILPCEYDNIETFIDGYSTGVKDGKLCVLKLSNNTVAVSQLPAHGDGITYVNHTLGFSLVLPDSWKGQYDVTESSTSVSFLHKASEGKGRAGTLFSIVRSDGNLSPMEARQGAGLRYPVMQTDKYTYVLAHPSGQECTGATEVAYNKMSQDAVAIGQSIQSVAVTNNPTVKTLTQANGKIGNLKVQN